MDLLRQIVSRLVEVYAPDRIYLLGSHARGEAGPESEYDILVVVPDDAAPDRKRSRLAYDALWPVGRSGDIIVMTRGAFESARRARASLAAAVAREGRTLYER